MNSRNKVPWIGLALVVFTYVVVSTVAYREPLSEVLVEAAFAAVLGAALLAVIGYVRSRRD